MEDPGKIGLLDNTTHLPLYKNKKLILILIGTIIAITLVIIILVVIFSNSSNQITLIPKEESNLAVINPDIGLFQHWYLIVNETHVTKRTKKKVTDAIHHLRVDLSAFSKAVNGEKDKKLTDAALKGIEEILKEIRADGKNAITRFNYDPLYKGNADKECEMDMVITHIKQLGKIVNKYPDVITAIEAGMLGKWGEMHTSQIVTPENIQKVIDTWMDCTDNIPILVRYPKFHYYFAGGKTKIDEMVNVTYNPGDRGYRLGLFDDGMYGDDRDLGTWMQNRTKETQYIGKQNDHLPYGGEPVWRKTTETYYLENCIPEMFLLHMSHINNMSGGYEGYEIWKNTTYNVSIAGHPVFKGKSGFDFVKAHLGYRLVMKKITINKNGNSFKLKIDIENNGFGYVVKKKQIGLVYSYDDSIQVKEENNLGTYLGNQKEINIEGNFIKDRNKKYKVYLRMYYDIKNGTVTYPVSLANINCYNEKLKGNYLFTYDYKEGNFYI